MKKYPELSGTSLMAIRKGVRNTPSLLSPCISESRPAGAILAFEPIYSVHTLRAQTGVDLTDLVGACYFGIIKPVDAAFAFFGLYPSALSAGQLLALHWISSSHSSLVGPTRQSCLLFGVNEEALDLLAAITPCLIQAWFKSVNRTPRLLQDIVCLSLSTAESSYCAEREHEEDRPGAWIKRHYFALRLLGKEESF